VEASLATRSEAPRKLDGEKAQRIVAAMRTSVARRGAAASTFDVVAREAGVSRGLLHYYFGSKERLLVEVVRHDSDLRVAQLTEALADAHSIDAVIDVLVRQVRQFVAEDPGAQALLYEMFSASRSNDEIRAELAALWRRQRAHVAGTLREKEREGVIKLRGDAEAVVSVLFALGDGFELQLLADAEWDSDAAFETGIQTARFLFGAAD
jgi:AcrR family transcriptional regulator